MIHKSTSTLGAADIIKWLSTRVQSGADLHLDSRRVQRGDVFCAVSGQTYSASHFIADAFAAGAAAVVCDADDAPRDQDNVLVVDGLRHVLGELGDQWYGKPSAALTVVAVTGTNGKTSTTQWIAQAFARAGKACGAIGTLGVVWPDGTSDSGALTTPDVLSMHRVLGKMRDEGAELVALEASSIGVVQGRLDGVRIALAGFTNLTRDHLDFHADMQDYESAKARLFAWPGLQASIINIDDAAGARLHAAVPSALTYAVGPEAVADIVARDVGVTARGQTFTLRTPSGEARIVTQLLGLHNIYNLLLVAGTLHQLGWSLSQVAHALSVLDAVPGRLQTVDAIETAAYSNSRSPLVIVDYAHTPDALGHTLSALRPVADARAGTLWCVFGCGGDRDPGKRPEMGRLAQRLADRVVITSDNPRSESPATIIEQIVRGCEALPKPIAITDRAIAIMTAVWQAGPNDVVLLAGKGHETYQEIAGERHPFDDREWARLAMLLVSVPGISTDSRSVAKGEAFLALIGPNFDGHAYLTQAAQAGACAAIVAHRVDHAMPQVVVGQTGAALLRMGSAWRKRFELPVIAVAGSNGKTTTKEMIACILANWLGAENRLATVGNLNNDIGVPLTLLRLRTRDRAAVIEVGMNHPGEIEGLAKLTAPSVAVVTNAQREHQEFMQSVEAVARENGEVFKALAADGVAVYPRDDMHASIWDDMAAHATQSTFGLSSQSDVYADDIHADERGTRCVIVTPQGRAALTLNVPGLHNLRNALAACAATLAVGTPLGVAVDALAQFSAVSGRMQQKQLPDGVVLIDDTYNANPDSVRAAIDVLARMPAPRVLALGDMGEVGANGPAMHEEVGAYAREQGIDVLLTLGDASAVAAEVFGARGRACQSVDEVVAGLRAARAASVLVKGSRFMRMERVVNAFAGDRHAA